MGLLDQKVHQVESVQKNYLPPARIIRGEFNSKIIDVKFTYLYVYFSNGLCIKMNLKPSMQTDKPDVQKKRQLVR